MKKLNELVELANRANIAGQGTPDMADFRVTASPGNILAIAEEFRALEQRAEAAEEKLAELERQEGRVVFTCTGCEHSVFDEHPSCCDCGQGDGYTMSKVFTRPAPAINLADLVPEEKSTDIDYAYYPLTKARHEGWNACRAAILRNIDEQSK